ncbi:hypothetical protein HID58_078935 [Brassica napus]|uniref:Uncharacterized protein n=1 Tax=Brassica napus TaxID=3708 RepID=A0ABQ7XED9_BRANA|nr:hypothetical protein HID58_078935 [Brassica napus]
MMLDDVHKVWLLLGFLGLSLTKHGDQEVSCDVDDDELSLNHIVDEEDFRSCCGDDEQMFFKGVSITERGDSVLVIQDRCCVGEILMRRMVIGLRGGLKRVSRSPKEIVGSLMFPIWIVCKEPSSSMSFTSLSHLSNLSPLVVNNEAA